MVTSLPRLNLNGPDGSRSLQAPTTLKQGHAEPELRMGEKSGLQVTAQPGAFYTNRVQKANLPFALRCGIISGDHR